MPIGGEGEKGESRSGEVGLEVRTRKLLLKPSSKRKESASPLCPPQSLQMPGQKAATTPLAGTPHPGQKVGWMEGATGLPLLYPVAGASMRKAEEPASGTPLKENF